MNNDAEIIAKLQQMRMGVDTMIQDLHVMGRHMDRQRKGVISRFLGSAHNRLGWVDMQLAQALTRLETPQADSSPQNSRGPYES